MLLVNMGKRKIQTQIHSRYRGFEDKIHIYKGLQNIFQYKISGFRFVQNIKMNFDYQ